MVQSSLEEVEPLPSPATPASLRALGEEAGEDDGTVLETQPARLPDTESYGSSEAADLLQAVEAKAARTTELAKAGPMSEGAEVAPTSDGARAARKTEDPKVTFAPGEVDPPSSEGSAGSSMVVAIATAPCRTCGKVYPSSDMKPSGSRQPVLYKCKKCCSIDTVGHSVVRVGWQRVGDGGRLFFCGVLCGVRGGGCVSLECVWVWVWWGC